MKSTYFALMAEFNTGDIPLKVCCEKYFGLSIQKAGSRARAQQLPVPCFRGGSQKSEWLISIEDLAEWLEKMKEEARTDWNRINAA